jgi:hypothetical protein
MTSILERLYRSHAIARSVAIIVSILAIAAAATLLWIRHVRTTPAEETLAKLAAIDTRTRHKICAHRCNNLPKYREAVSHFNCVEIDVVLDPPTGGPPAVYHPPHENNHGLTLNLLLSQERLPAGRLWLDVKDLSASNWAPLLDRLVKLVPPARHGSIIVETGWSDPGVHQASAAFRTRGFAVSYYLPTEETIDCGALRSPSCDALRLQVLSTVSRGFSHLSFDARAHAFVTSIRKELPPALRLLTWDLSKSWPQPDLLDEVDVYIVRFPSRHST